MNEEDRERVFENSMRDKIQHMINQMKISNLNQQVPEELYHCFRQRWIYLNVLRLKIPHIHRDFDLIILQSLLNGRHFRCSEKKLRTCVSLLSVTSIDNEIDDRIEQFQLAFEWNRIDIVQNSILKDDQQWNVI